MDRPSLIARSTPRVNSRSNAHAKQAMLPRSLRRKLRRFFDGYQETCPPQHFSNLGAVEVWGGPTFIVPIATAWEISLDCARALSSLFHGVVERPRQGWAKARRCPRIHGFAQRTWTRCNRATLQGRSGETRFTKHWPSSVDRTKRSRCAEPCPGIGPKETRTILERENC
jgi:hypothetical protein